MSVISSAPLTTVTLSGPCAISSAPGRLARRNTGLPWATAASAWRRAPEAADASTTRVAIDSPES